MNKKVTIIGICGSLRENSFTRLALKCVLKEAENAGAETQFIDLREFNLVFCGAHRGDESDPYPDDVIRLRNLVKNAQGIVLGTPEYHGSFSGVLKNALDLMGFDEFEGKMLGLVGVSAGSLGANYAISTLRSVGRSMHAWVVPEQVSIPFVDQVFSSDGELINEEVATKLKNLGRQVARFSYLHSSSDAQEFIKAWEKAPNNPGANYSEK